MAYDDESLLSFVLVLRTNILEICHRFAIDALQIFHQNFNFSYENSKIDKNQEMLTKVFESKNRYSKFYC